MSLNEDRIRSAMSGRSGNAGSGSGGSVGGGARASYNCTYTCQEQKQSGCNFCETNCQSCQMLCETGCQDTCEKGCQDSCQRGCQSEQCGSCEYGQCGSCESCQGCQSTCERNYQCGSCQSGCQGCQTTCEKSTQNTAPTTPTSITVPQSARPSASITISWGSSTDTNLAGYILERKTGNGNYTEIYKGASRSYTDTVPKDAGSLTYRVKAYDSGGLSSSYKVSNAITIITNISPTISDRDRDLGGKKSAFTIPISVDDPDSTDTLTLTAKLNGAIIRTIDNAKRGTSYDIEITSDKLNQLTINADNEVEISATDGKATTYRRFKFRRVNSAPKVNIEVSELGTKNAPFEVSYTVTDPERDNVDIKIMYGNKVLHLAKNVEQGKKHTWRISKLDFAQIPSGDQVLKVEATDAHGGREVKLVTFKKTIDGCGYILKRETKEMAKQIIVSTNTEIADGSQLKIYVCNNALDNSPKWEEVEEKLIYTIKNTSKTASKWAVGVKVEIKRTTQTKGDSYLYGIGVNYR